MNSIWYKSPADKWEDALAAGNGRLGAMVYGNIQHEIIDLNEESLWSKPYARRNNKNAKSALKKIRELLKLERPQEAQELVYESFTGLPEEQAFYKSAGRVHLDFYNKESYGLENSDGVRSKAFGTPVFYKRELDMETAVISTTFTEETVLPSTDDFSRNTTGSSITYNREVFVSTQEDVLVIHLWASTPRSIYLRASLENENADRKFSCGEDVIGLQSFNGIPFAMMLGAVAPGGKISVSGNSLIVEDADEVTLYVDVETAFALSSFAKKSHRQFKNARLASRASDIALKKICFAMNAHYAYIKKAHLDENPALYSRMQLSLGEKASESESTSICAEELLKDTSTPEYAELYFKYMRYLYLNSTKPRAKLPPLENGLFSNPDDELWHERYYFDRLYPYGLTGCLCNAKKSDEVLFKLLKLLNRHGRRTAFEMFGAEGSAAFDSTDLWGDTAPCGTELDSSYNAAGLARLAALVTEYYESTLNKKFIKKNAGIIKNACAFFENYLVLVDEKSRAILNPAFSKGEKQFITEGNFELEKEIAALFKSALKAFNYAEIPTDSDCVVKAKEMLSKLKAEPKSEAALTLPDSLMAGSVHDAGLIIRNIISSEMNGNAIEITLLPGAKGALATGEVKNVSLKGNLFANLTWKDGRIVSGNLFTKTSGSFVDTTVIWYQGKKFNARLMNGSISLMNVLPTTV